MSASTGPVSSWGLPTYGDPCRECGYRWDLSLQDAVALVDEAPSRYRSILEGRDGTERHPRLAWSAGAYVCHVADNLRIWAERLTSAVGEGITRVTVYDPDELADDRGYDRIPLADALGALEQSVRLWTVAIAAASAAKVRLDHPTRGPQSVLDVARTNAHDTAHHLWDVSRSLDASTRARVPAGDVEIRLVRPEEYGVVGELLVTSYDGVEGAQVDPDYNNEMRDVHARVGQAEVLVAVDTDGRILGTVTYLPRPSPLSELAEAGEAEFRMFAVAPQVRGRGIGRLLVEDCLRRAREQGLQRVWLSTSPWMLQAQDLYGSMGFCRASSRDHTQLSSDLTFELLAYVLDL